VRVLTPSPTALTSLYLVVCFHRYQQVRDAALRVVAGVVYRAAHGRVECQRVISQAWTRADRAPGHWYT